MDPRKLERLLKLLTKYGVTRYDPKTGALELGPGRPAAAADASRPARVDARDTKSVDEFLRTRLAPAGGSS
jgi:DNA-binding IclR family transcriptional regulator